LEKDRAWKNAGEEEAGRLRAESQAKELQKSVKLMQMRLQDAQHQSEQVAKQHAQEVALAKKAANQKIAHLQDQIQKLKKAKEEGADASESDLTIKALRLNVQKLEEEVASIKSELQKTSNERERDVAKHGIAVGRLKEQLEESEASRSKLSEELEKVQHDLEVAKRSTGSASGSGAVSPVTFSAVHAKRAKMIQNFEKSVANDSNVVDSLVAQIRVMKKAQPSKKVKEGLAAKEKALEEKRESHIKTLEKIEKLQTQQSTELHQELDKVTAEVEAARKAWLACEQQLLDTADAATRGNLQAKTDAAAMRFSVARRRWQAVKSELSNLLTQVSENRGKIAELRNPDDGDAATTTTATTGTLVGNQVDVSTGSHQPPTKRGSSQSGRRPQTKRQKTGSS
jgi:chromosome segregation ATPase